VPGKKRPQEACFYLRRWEWCPDKLEGTLEIV
jgi:hypothetical protein